jgi:hypothetical protein
MEDRSRAIDLMNGQTRRKKHAMHAWRDIGDGKYTYTQTSNMVKLTSMPHRSCRLVMTRTAAASDAAAAPTRSAAVVATCFAEATFIVAASCDSSSTMVTDARRVMCGGVSPRALDERSIGEGREELVDLWLIYIWTGQRMLLCKCPKRHGCNLKQMSPPEIRLPFNLV